MKHLNKLALCLVLLGSSALSAHQKEHIKEVQIKINIKTTDSKELQQFLDSIPKHELNAANSDEWKGSFIRSMIHLIHVADSDGISETSWSVKTKNEHGH
ncbi:MAG: hypothetical protein K2P51_01465 [Rhabdochlamydiaceae bacterium]|nr:hypothetical protein [Rhabdochlamydiaceae bacterium]